MNSKTNLKKQDRLFIERIAKKIFTSGFTTPAVFFLEMTKPLALLGSHLLIFLGPVINSIIQSDAYYRSVQVFEEPDNIELLLKEIERLEWNSRKKEGAISEG
tara:strand:+ start:76 stop:384 length:309 start_codon:yes stop_codon:yes gene_type:complete